MAFILVLILIKILVPFLIIFNIIPLMVWLERKGSAFIQDRHGPNRAAIMGVRMGGLLHSLADVIKFMFKEDIIPSQANKTFYVLAPFLTLVIACVTFAVIPFAHPITVAGKVFTFQAADLNVGILYILAMSSLGVFGIMLAGWASNNKYALMGGVRSSAQMFSYEISMGLALMSVILLAGNVELNEIVINQGTTFWTWNFFRQPLAFLLFLVAAFAETNRSPFDLPEGESEIVAGYHTEYSSIKFAMFFMAEYAHIIVASALISLLFFGGWQVPFLSVEMLRNFADEGIFFILIGHAVVFVLIGFLLIKKYQPKHYRDIRDKEVLVFGIPFLLIGLSIGAYTLLHGPFSLGDFGGQIFQAAVQFGVFMGKVLFFCWFFIWVRWTLPRFRYDQLMKLGWKVMIPLSLANLIVTGMVMLIYYD